MAKKGHDELPGDLQLEVVLRKYASNLYGGLRGGGDNSVDAVYLRRRGASLWMAVVKRTEAGTGAKQVLFATAGSFAAALIEASKAVARGDWKVDRPWRGVG